MECIPVLTRGQRRQFLALPRQLYPPERIPQDAAAEARLLTGRHVLSDAFALFPFLVTEGAAVLARGGLSVYPGDETGYVGFFECAENRTAAFCLLDTLARQAGQLGLKRLLGPLDGSFWLRYRFKTDHFSAPYTGEPWNLPYYPALWQEWGFRPFAAYASYRLRPPAQADGPPPWGARLDRMKALGCTFRSPSAASFRRDLRAVFHLMSRLYAPFPGYKPITWAQFQALYGGLRYVADLSMIFLAEYRGELAGFLVALPDYGRSLGQLGVGAVLQRLSGRPPRGYVLMYLGAVPQLPGLGGALAELAWQQLRLRRCGGVSALIRQHGASAAFCRGLSEQKLGYLLMDCPLPPAATGEKKL